jgi:hypothetical protein
VVDPAELPATLKEYVDERYGPALLLVERCRQAFPEAE